MDGSVSSAHIYSVVLISMMPACASAPPPPSVPAVEAVIAAPPAAASALPVAAWPALIDFVVENDVNPDARGRASPVIIKMYELKSAVAFNTADYFTLFDHASESLGAELVGRDELPLIPGDRRQLIKNLNAQTRYLGIVASFRNLEDGRWRAITMLPTERQNRVQVSVRKNEVSISAK